MKPTKVHLRYVSRLHDPGEPYLPLIHDEDFSCLGDAVRHILFALDPSDMRSHTIESVTITPVYNPF